MNHKRGQVTIFIIIAIVVVAIAVLLYFVFSSAGSQVQIPQNLEPVYSNFLTCLENDVSTGASVLESQGGYIELPEFEPGSKYMPFSSQLNFLGNPVPYWYYVSGNNLEKEQRPSKNEMEDQLEDFIESRVRDCEFQSYREQGFSIDMEEPDANIDINDESIELDLDLGFGIERADESVFVRSHSIEVNSKLGSLYNSALEIYEEQQEELFLEEYGVDVLRSYAPVDGVEIQCSPLTWSADNVATELREALEVNTFALNENPDEYYNLELPIEHRARFLNSQNWPSTIEIAPNEGDFLVSNPVGNQQGLGVLGFCYAPYHFTYNVRYPVLIQVYDEENPDEIFQFPMAVLIEGNQPRTPSDVEAIPSPEVQLCDFRNTEATIEVFDSNLNSIDNARISYECLSQKCNIGQTENGVLEGKFPQCVNGYVVADADGYEQDRYLFSTVGSGNLQIVLDNIYSQRVNVNVENTPFNGNAIITFISEDRSEKVVYPEDTLAELSEGSYDIQVQVYEESTVNLGTTTTEQCIDVSRGGVLGAFGLTEERCFDIEVPEQEISPVLVGGGNTEIYLTSDDLSSGRTLEINVESFGKPETIEEIQTNYILIENSEAEVSFA